MQVNSIVMKLFICLVFFTGMWPPAQAQKKKKIKEEKLNNLISARDSSSHIKKFILMGKNFGSSVVLRWAPKTSAAWDKANVSGYQLYRFELDEKNNNPLTNEVQLTPAPLKPFSLDQWKKQFQPEDTAAAVAAELLYGKKFEISQPKNGQLNWGDAYTKLSDMENRLGIALLNADLHPEIATGMAWRWEDKTIQENKLYYYMLVSPAADQQQADTVSALVSTKQTYAAPEMLPVFAMPWDRTVTLYWNKPVAAHMFTCYYLERSDDNGKNFHRLNNLPYIDGSGKEKKDWIHFTDSIPQNYKLYVYRVRGVTAFGELSTPSVPVRVSGVDKTSPGSPANVKAENLKGSEVKITWQKASNDKDLAGFLVGRANSSGGPFFPLDTVLLPPSAQSYVDRQAVTWDKNFYIVAAIDTAGNAARSMPAYAIIIDSTPPAVPVGLIGTIDTSGIVRMHWRWNKEMDLQGYNVYASNNAHTFYVLNTSYITDTTFVDTITIKTLTRHIYYRICAFDKAGNPSAYSKILELTKPDIVAPVAPVITHFLVTDSSVLLQWAVSSSDDVAKQMIWRKEKTEPEWMLLRDSINKDSSVYVDRRVQKRKEYEYSITAVDSSGLSSEHSFPLQARVYDNGRRKAIESLQIDLTADHTIRLQWTYGQADRQQIRFIIYRNYNNTGLEMYKSVPGDKNEFTDTTPAGKGDYQYAVKVVTSDGGVSELISTETIKYEP